MSIQHSMLAPLVLIVLAACGDADPRTIEGSPSRDADTAREANDPSAPSTASSDSDEDTNELGSFEPIATGLQQAYDIVVQGGIAYVTTYGGLMKVTASGEIEKVDGWSHSLSADDRTIAWFTGGALVTAPFSNIGARVSRPIAGKVDNSVVSGSHVFFTEFPDWHAKSGAILRVETGSNAPPRSVTPNVANNAAAIAADASHVYFFAPPNEHAVELRRVRTAGGESERLAIVPTTRGWEIALGNELVFFSTGSHVYALPKGGGTAPRVVGEGHGLVADPTGVFVASSKDRIFQVRHVNHDGQKSRLVAQLYNEYLELAVDGRDLYGLSSKTGTVYRLRTK